MGQFWRRREESATWGEGSELQRGGGERERKKEKDGGGELGIPFGRWVLCNPKSLQNQPGPPNSPSRAPRSPQRMELLNGGRTDLLGDPCFGGGWGSWESSVSLPQLLCSEKSSCENLFPAISRVNCQTKKSQHGTSSGRTFAFESISDPRHLRSLPSAPDV